MTGAGGTVEGLNEEFSRLLSLLAGDFSDRAICDAYRVALDPSIQVTMVGLSSETPLDLLQSEALRIEGVLNAIKQRTGAAVHATWGQSFRGSGAHSGASSSSASHSGAGAAGSGAAGGGASRGNSRSRPQGPRRCWHCNEIGHIMRDCPNRNDAGKGSSSSEQPKL